MKKELQHLILLKSRYLLTKQLQQEAFGGAAAVTRALEELEEEPATKPKRSNAPV